jgi:hypothetical protein
VNGSTDAIIGPNGTTFTTTNTSTSWRIEDIRVVCDIVTLDSSLQNSYAEHVLSGKAFPINYSTYISQYQTITTGNISANVSSTTIPQKLSFSDSESCGPVL